MSYNQIITIVQLIGCLAPVILHTRNKCQKKRGTTLAEQIKLLHATRPKAKRIKEEETKGSLKKRRQISL